MELEKEVGKKVEKIPSDDEMEDANVGKCPSTAIPIEQGKIQLFVKTLMKQKTRKLM